MDPNSITTIGDITVDTFFEIDDQEASVLCNFRNQEEEICFNYGEKIPVKSSRESFGGSSLNTAIGFNNLGLNTGIASIVGDDREGKDTAIFLKDNGIDTEALINEGNNNHATIIIYKKERTIFSYHNPRDYRKINIPQTKYLYLASAGKGSDVLCEKITKLVNTGSTLFFNPGSWELKNFDPFRPLIKYCQAFIINKDEADFVIGEMKIKEQLSQILKLGSKIAVITDAENGAFIAYGEKYFHLNTVARHIVDPTGAGDAFSSGFVSGIIYGKTPEEASGWGMLNAAQVISNEGANSDLLKLEDMINSYQNEKQNLIASGI